MRKKNQCTRSPRLLQSRKQRSTFSYIDGGREYWIDITSPTYTSREALGVFIIKSKAWKVFSNTNMLKRNQRDYELANDHGLPIDGATIYPGVVRRSNRPSRSGYALVTQNMDNTRFFDFQKKEAQFKKLITPISDRNTLDRIYRSCQSAVEIGLRDPQGFIGASDNEPITFIDVHTNAVADGQGGYTFGSSPAAEEMLRFIITESLTFHARHDPFLGKSALHVCIEHELLGGRVGIGYHSRLYLSKAKWTAVEAHCASRIDAPKQSSDGKPYYHSAAYFHSFFSFSLEGRTPSAVLLLLTRKTRLLHTLHLSRASAKSSQMHRMKLFATGDTFANALCGPNEIYGKQSELKAGICSSKQSGE
ncbi:hypothetical protein DFH11DRAFT_1741676 [Phellopilus nigrolimitatus]|nr:hypothetical protein DFH11DRAFT_1741676 [Phellopilus nigrolimitatus]